MAVLSNQSKTRGLSRYNFKDDMAYVMGLLEAINIGKGDDGRLYLEGSVDLAQINRIRQILGMEPL